MVVLTCCHSQRNPATVLRKPSHAYSLGFSADHTSFNSSSGRLRIPSPQQLDYGVICVSPRDQWSITLYVHLAAHRLASSVFLPEPPRVYEEKPQSLILVRKGKAAFDIFVRTPFPSPFRHVGVVV
jgi:hypothetical protein